MKMFIIGKKWALFSKNNFSKEDEVAGKYDVSGQSWMPGTPNKVIARSAHQGTSATALGKNRTKRTTDSIVLYMPPQLTSNYASGYKENELGGGVMEGAQRINSIIDKSASVGYPNALKEAVPGAAGQAARLVEKALAKTLSGIVGGDAIIDDCGVCSGGITGLIPNDDVDCAGICYGEAEIDNCGVCAGGITDNIPNNDDLGCGCFLGGPSDYYADIDNDGFGYGEIQSFCEDPGAGWTLNGDDPELKEIVKDPVEYKMIVQLLKKEKRLGRIHDSRLIKKEFQLSINQYFPMEENNE